MQNTFYAEHIYEGKILRRANPTQNKSAAEQILRRLVGCAAVCRSVLQCGTVYYCCKEPMITNRAQTCEDIIGSLQHSAPHYSTPQHVSTHCNTLQHTAT